MEITWFVSQNVWKSRDLSRKMYGNHGICLAKCMEIAGFVSSLSPNCHRINGNAQYLLIFKNTGKEWNFVKKQPVCYKTYWGPIRYFLCKFSGKVTNSVPTNQHVAFEEHNSLRKKKQIKNKWFKLTNRDLCLKLIFRPRHYRIFFSSRSDFLQENVQKIDVKPDSFFFLLFRLLLILKIIH